MPAGVPLTQISLEDVRMELSLVPPVSLSQCIAAAGKTGLWNKLSDFAGYRNSYCTVSPASMNFDSTGNSQTATVSSNTTWTVSDNASWITITGAANTGNDSFSVTCNTNTGMARNGTVTITWSGTNRTIDIFQEADGGGGGC